VTVPGTSNRINLPDRKGREWYAGIGALVAVEMIEWTVALLIASTHFVENHSRDVQELEKELTRAPEPGPVRRLGRGFGDPSR
jgi:hypothetical protein